MSLDLFRRGAIYYSRKERVFVALIMGTKPAADSIAFSKESAEASQAHEIGLSGGLCSMLVGIAWEFVGHRSMSEWWRRPRRRCARRVRFRLATPGVQSFARIEHGRPQYGVFGEHRDEIATGG